MAFDTHMRQCPWRRIARRQRIGESGSFAIEFAFGLPLLLMFLLGVIQYGGYFVLQQEMALAARDAVRGLALGALTEAEAVSQVQGKLTGWKAPFTVTASAPDPANPDDTDATVLVSVPYADAALIKFLNTVVSGNLKARVTMRSEV